MDIKKLADRIHSRDLTDPAVLTDYFEALRIMADEDFEEAHQRNKEVRMLSARGVREHGDARLLELNKRSLLFDAPHDFDAAIRYAEFNRDPRKKFYEPRRKQLKRVVDALQALEERKIRILGIMMPPGAGKALADDTPVLTKNGWKNHGELHVGDEVIGMDGRFKRVVAVHQKCMLDVLVEFTNGEKIQCHENHEWVVFDRALGKIKVVETKYIEERTLEYGGEPNHRGHRYVLQIPNHNFVAGEEKELPLDPYTLGVWLGDGANKNPTICNAKCDSAIIEKIKSNGILPRWETVHKTTGVRYYGFGFRKDLQKFGMCHSRTKTEKHIPQCYLTASLRQRLELLSGLIDTDGTLSGKKYEFSTCDEKLKNTFIQLLSTFGWRATVINYKPVKSSSGVNGKRVCYKICFTPDLEIPCALARKKNNPIQKVRMLAIKNVKRVTPKVGNCITVDGDGTYLAGETMISTHNSTTGIMYMIWSGLRHPDLSILGGSHSNSFLRGIYDEINRMLDTKGEYLWHEIFPEIQIVNTNAKDMRIDLGNPKRFETFEFSSIGSGNAGKVRASNLLYADDLVDRIESAMSKERMDKLWQQYYTDLRQRMIGDCVELLIQTPWTLHDPIDRLELAHADDPQARFIHMPALDENDNSNFDYPYGVGFTTQFYHEQRDIMDDASWRAIFMTQPIEREGLLYSEDELRRYFELPDGEPDAILSICDTKDRGEDYAFMPVAYQYGTDYYIEFMLCDNGAPEIVEARLVSTLLLHNVQMSRFESNSAGGKIAEKVQGEVKKKGGRTKITTKYTMANKETKIIVNSPWVKEHCLFKDSSVIKKDKEYRRALNFLCSYTMAGRNKHDDVPDGMAMLAEFVQSLEGNKVEVFRRPF